MGKNAAWQSLWFGFRVVDINIEHNSACFHLEPDRQAVCCGLCPSFVSAVHDHVCRSVRDLPLVGKALVLKAWLFRLNCPQCRPCLQQFASRLCKYWPGIFARVRWPMHTGQLEGINNRIKLIKRMAYGYRDNDDFFLKIKATFPENL